MNTKNLIITLVTFIIIILVTDLVFNFSGKLMENFQDLQNLSNYKSIISKMEGKLVKIDSLNQSNNTIILPSPINKGQCISLSDNGVLVEEQKDTQKSNQVWKLIKINNQGEFRSVLGFNNKNGYSVNNNCVNFPFFIVMSTNPNKSNWVLQYDYGKLISRPLGNYNSQKWDASDLEPNYDELNKDDICYSHCNNARYGNSPMIQGVPEDTSEKIKINLNLKDEYLKNLFSNISDNNQTNNNSDNLIVPKDSISSLCPGCNLD